MSSCVKCETMASNEDWKARGGKTKRGKPTGRREVTEKYKANQATGLDGLCKNHKQYKIQRRVGGYGFNRYAPFIPPMLAKDRRQASKLALRDQLLSVENETDPELEEDARAEDNELLPEVDCDDGAICAIGSDDYFFVFCTIFVPATFHSSRYDIPPKRFRGLIISSIGIPAILKIYTLG